MARIGAVSKIAKRTTYKASGSRYTRIGKPCSSKIESFNTYIYKVLKQVHPELGMSSMAMQIVNDILFRMFERIAEVAMELRMLNKRVGLSARDIQTAVRLVLPGELTKHAVSEGTRAVGKFSRI